MNKHCRISFARIVILAALVLPLASATAAPSATDPSAPAGARKPLSYDAYDGWRSIQGNQLSRDGQWLVYALTPQDGDGELVALNLNTNKEYRAARGRQPVLTVDGKFVVFTIAPLKADVDKAKKDKKKPDEQPKSALGVMDLATGQVTTIDRVKSFKVPEESGAVVAYLLEPPLKKPDEKKEPEAKPEQKPEAKPAAKPEEKKAEEPKKEEKKKEPGNDLVVRELASGKESKIAEVAEYVWNKPGTWLAYGVSSKTPESDGAFALEPASGRTVALLKGLGNYKNLTFDEKGLQLAFTSDRDDYKAEKSASKLYHWASTAAAAAEIAPAAAKGFPAGMAVGENGRLQFSKDGGRLFFGIAAVPKPEPKDAPEPVKVDVWSWRDPYLQPMQKVQAEDEKKRTLMCVIHFLPKEKKFVQLATEDVPDVTLSEDAKVALGTSDLPYRQLVSWDQGYRDVYIVNVNDGSRKRVLERSSGGARLSPGGAWVYYFSQADNAWFTTRVADGKTFNLTGKLGVSFVDEEDDMPADDRPYGTAGWTDGDKAILIYDRYDIWELSPDGAKSRMVTNGLGRRDKLVLRYARLDPEQTTIPGSGPLLLPASDEKTLATGAYRLDLAAPTADPAKVVMLDKQLGGLQKAKNADVYAHTRQRFDEFPDLWVSGPDLTWPRPARSATPTRSRPSTTGARPSASSTPTPTARSFRRCSSSPRTSTRRRSTRSWSTSTRPRPWACTGTTRPLRARASTSPATSATAMCSSARTSSMRSAIRGRARSSASSRPSTRSSTWASSTRSGSASRATAGADTRSAISSPRPTSSRPSRRGPRSRT